MAYVNLAMPRFPKRKPNMQHPLCKGMKIFSVFHSPNPENLVSSSTRGAYTFGSPTFSDINYNTGPQYTNGFLRFEDSKNTYIRYGNVEAPGNGKSFTLVLCGRLDTGYTFGQPTGLNLIAGNWTGTAGTSDAQGWGLCHYRPVIPGTTGISMVFANSSGTVFNENPVVISPNTDITRWGIWILTFDYDRQVAKLYRNTLLRATQTFSIVPYGVKLSERAFHVGGDGLGHGVNADIQWVALFDHCMPKSMLNRWGRGLVEDIFDEPPLLPPDTGTKDTVDTLSFSESDRFLIRPARTSDAVSFSEVSSATRRRNFISSDTITFSDSTDADKILGRQTQDVLPLGETNTYNQILHRSTSDVLPLKDGRFVQVGNTTVFVPGNIGTISTGRRKNVLQGRNRSIVLPSPIFGDTEANGDSLKSVFRTETGRRVITIQRRTMRVLRYTFNVTRQKVIEFQEFIRTEIDNDVTWRNWKGEIWIGKIGTNPFVTTAQGRWGSCTEKIQVELELQAVRIH